MSKYRILEVEVETISGWSRPEYIPKYIVQEWLPPGRTKFGTPGCYKSVKEFNNLEEARMYKRKLELKNGGIVIE